MVELGDGLIDAATGLAGVDQPLSTFYRGFSRCLVQTGLPEKGLEMAAQTVVGAGQMVLEASNILEF